MKQETGRGAGHLASSRAGSFWTSRQRVLTRLPRQRSGDELAGLAARGGVTVFLTTHNMAEAEKLCARVAVIREGKLLAVGHPNELRAHTGGARAEIVGRGLTSEVVAMLQGRPEICCSAAIENGQLDASRFRDQVDIAPRWSRC